MRLSLAGRETEREKKEKRKKKKKGGGRRKEKGKKKKKEGAVGVECGACDDIYFFLSIFSPRSSVPPFAGQANGPVPAHTIHPTPIPVYIPVNTRVHTPRVATR